MVAMVKSKFGPGFRFHPTDVELVRYYLKRKVMGRKPRAKVIAELDIYKYAPWDLPDKSCSINGDLKWYFFCPREKKYAIGARTNRATDVGYWKTTGRDRPVLYNNEVTGNIKTLIFHTGKAPRGDRTDWVMHEYRLEDKDLAAEGIAQDAYVLCVVFQKDGPGPRNGAQYGAPFNEKDWDDDDEEEEEGEESHCIESLASTPATAVNHIDSFPSSVMNCVGSFSSAAVNPVESSPSAAVNCVESSPFAVVSSPVSIQTTTHDSSLATSLNITNTGCFGYSSAAVNPVKSSPSAAVNCAESFPSATVSAPVSMLANTHDSSPATSLDISDTGCLGSSSISCLSGAMPSPCNMRPSVTNNNFSQLPADDGMLMMLPALNGSNVTKKVDGHGGTDVAPSLDEIFKCLGDLDNSAALGCVDASLLELSELDISLPWEL
ncbi:NAC domain-containing protein [Quillaja saponaria]|uniref:NAC domain-containing protein n=1 Tax=Quillaja saponaria TaxID=32244 RepID=A0AAD7Q7P0_QUISA|nr:NAC domain-containing protein [Quillaja saponaria]